MSIARLLTARVLPAALLLALTCGAAAAQHPGSDGITRVIVMSPASGPPGTVVKLRPMYLPAITPVQISLGGARSGFEVLSQMMTDLQGEIADSVTTVTVPEWAERDRSYKFFVLDLYFKPLAASTVFHVTGPDGTILREGEIAAGEGKECRMLRTVGGEVYALSGRLGDLKEGEIVSIEGTLGEGSGCEEGTPLRVVRLRRVSP